MDLLFLKGERGVLRVGTVYIPGMQSLPSNAFIGGG